MTCIYTSQLDRDALRVHYIRAANVLTSSSESTQSFPFFSRSTPKEKDKEMEFLFLFSFPFFFFFLMFRCWLLLPHGLGSTLSSSGPEIGFPAATTTLVVFVVCCCRRIRIRKKEPAGASRAAATTQQFSPEMRNIHERREGQVSHDMDIYPTPLQSLRGEWEISSAWIYTSSRRRSM